MIIDYFHGNNMTQGFIVVDAPSDECCVQDDPRCPQLCR